MRGEEAARGALKRLIQRSLLRRSEQPEHWQFTHVLGYRFARNETGSDPVLRERLGRWLAEALAAALSANNGGAGEISLPRLLEHVAALLRADDDHRLWTPLAEYVLYDVIDRLHDLGRLDLVKLALAGVAGFLEALPPDRAEEPGWLRERLAASDASNARWQRDLSFSLTRLAEFHEDEGERTEAIPYAKASLQIDERLAALDPTNATWRNDVIASRALLARLQG